MEEVHVTCCQTSSKPLSFVIACDISSVIPCHMSSVILCHMSSVILCDVQEIVSFCHSRGVLVLVDGAHALGSMQLDLRCVVLTGEERGRGGELCV